MTMFENLDVRLQEVARADLEEMIRDCERELERRKQEAEDSAMKDILDAINEYVMEYGCLEISQRDGVGEETTIRIHRCETLIGHGGLISVVLV